MARLIIANLDCEQDWATPGKPARKLPKDVLGRISTAGTLLAALGRAGDLLWTPAPVAEERALLLRARGNRLCTGALADAAGLDRGGRAQILCWGETRAVHRLRAPAEMSARSPRPDAPWPDALWSVAADPDVAGACNDRRYAFAVQRELGLSLPGAKILRSVDELEKHLAAGGHMYGHHFGHGSDSDAGGAERTWVLEAPFSASGRFRLRRRGAALDSATRMRAWRLFATFKELIFQPWVERLVDVGCVGLITGASEWSLIGHHVLETNGAGVFRGIALEPTPADETCARAIAECRAVADEVAQRLAADGYRGPFGVDGFAYRAPGGATRVYPMCEINARVTFGLLLHAMAYERGLGRARLRLDDSGLAPPPDAVPLVAPAPGEPGSAWLEVESEP